MTDEDTPRESEVETLVRCNIELGEAERTQKRSFFEDVLDGDFRFRRRDGTTVDKDQFIDGLADAGNVSETLTTTIRQVQVLDDQAFVEAWVYLKGTRGGNPVDGTFRNLRLFERRNGAWRCVMWFNKPLPDGTSSRQY